MEITELEKRQNIEQNKKLMSSYTSFWKMISELKKKEIPSEIVNSINQFIKDINSFSGSNKDLLKQMRKSRISILKLIEKELKIVPKNLYRNRWLAIGISGFGVPFGVAFGVVLGNMAFLGIGLPIGLGIGMAIGAEMDKKALKEGRQLDLEISY